jgi:hypothetical protein
VKDIQHVGVFSGFVAAVASAVTSDWLHWLDPVQGHSLGLVLLHAVALGLLTAAAIRLVSPVGGVAAGLCLLFYPCLLGHAFNNAKDLCAADFCGLGLLAGALFLRDGLRRDGIAAGVYFGIAASSKLNGLFGLLLWLVWAGLVLFSCWRATGQVDRLRVRGLVWIPLLAGVVFFLVWPSLLYGGPSTLPSHVRELLKYYQELGACSS